MRDRTSGRPATSGGRPFASPTAGTTRPALSSSPRGSGHALPAVLAPGASLVVPVDVASPPTPGRHTLVLDLLHEHVRWFGRELSLEVDVRPTLCVAILGVDEDAAAAVAAGLAEVAPDVRPVLLTASPGETTEARGYAAGPDARSYVLGEADARGRLRSAAGARRPGHGAPRRRRARAPRGPSAPGRAVRRRLPGGAARRRRARPGRRRGGEHGEREALQQRAALLAARTLGLETIVLGRTGDDLPTELLAVVDALRGRAS